MTRVRADMNLCQSSGQCELVAAEISELGEGVLGWKVEVDPSLRQKSLEAVEACPIQAILAED
jgi:ferredoxin